MIGVQRVPLSRKIRVTSTRKSRIQSSDVLRHFAARANSVRPKTADHILECKEGDDDDFIVEFREREGKFQSESVHLLQIQSIFQLAMIGETCI